MAGLHATLLQAYLDDRSGGVSESHTGCTASRRMESIRRLNAVWVCLPLEFSRHPLGKYGCDRLACEPMMRSPYTRLQSNARRVTSSCTCSPRYRIWTPTAANVVQVGHSPVGPSCTSCVLVRSMPRRLTRYSQAFKGAVAPEWE